MNILDKIVAHKRTELEHLPDAPVSVESLAIWNTSVPAAVPFTSGRVPGVENWA